MSKKDSRLARAGVSGFNKPKRTPNHPKKSHIVVAKEGDKIKIWNSVEDEDEDEARRRIDENSRELED